MLKRLLSAALAASLLMLPGLRAQADVHALIGVLGTAAIVCGATGGCRGNGASASSGGGGRTCGPQCQSNVEAQRALAYFGYNPGGADGVWGQNSRRAASGFEAEMGFYPVDGQLNNAERAFLVSSYNRAESGYLGPHQQAMSTGGPRALLASFNQERLGQFQAPGTGTTVVTTAPGVVPVQPAPSTGVVVQPAPGTVVAAPAPQVVPAPGTTTVVAAPVPAPAPAPAAGFTGFSLATAAPSMTEFCATALQATPDATATLVTAAADQALGQQFCLARAATQSDGEALRGSIAGMTPEQVVAQCQGLSGVMGPTLAALPTQPRDGAETAARTALGGMAAEQAIVAGRICLSVGYEQDDAEMALAGALVLAAQGQKSYGELVGHHLRQGFGVAANENAARDWLLSTADAISAGATPGFLAEDATARVAVIRGALAGTGGVSEGVITEAASEATVLPTFTLNEN